MAKTRDDIIRNAASVMGIVTGSDPIDASDSEIIDVAAAAAQLAGEHIVDLTGQVAANGVPDEFFLPFSEYVAACYGSRFGQSLEWCESIRAVAMGKLRTIAQPYKPVMNVSTNEIYTNRTRGMR